MGRREYDQSCSFAGALDRVGERWSLLIVRELLLGPLRFSDLVVNVGGAPTDVLTKRLRDLERHGIVRRRPLDPPATGSAYELTELGRGLEAPILELGRWGMHFEQVDDIVNLPATSLANAVRLILQPPPEARMSVGLRSDGREYSLRIEDGRVAAARGALGGVDLTLGGQPAAVLAALVVGEAAEEGVEIEGERGALEALRAMVVLPDRLREAAVGLVAEGITTAA